MMASNQKLVIFGIVTTLLSLAMAGATLRHQIVSDREQLLVSKESRFNCALKHDSRRGDEVWTVTYRNERGFTKDWLRMVWTMGGRNKYGQPFNPQVRCDEIATKLDRYREDGLIKFHFRTDPATPGQYVLCAFTQLSGDACLQVLTLWPEDNPYDELKYVTEALWPGNPESYQGAGNPLKDFVDNPVENSFIIPLEDQL